MNGNFFSQQKFLRHDQKKKYEMHFCLVLDACLTVKDC